MAADDAAVVVTMRASLKDYEAALKSAVRATERAATASEKMLSNIGSKARFTGLNQNAQQAGKSMQAMQADAKNLGFQINDLYTQIASGSGVMRALTQQGGQIAQIFSGRGIKAAATTFATALLDPWVALPIAIGIATTAAVAFFSDTENGASAAGKEMDGLVNEIEKIANAWGDLSPATKDALDQFVQLHRQRQAVQDMAAEIEKLQAIAAKKGAGLSGLFRGADIGSAEQNKILDQVEKINAAIVAGQPGIRETQALLDELFTLPPNPAVANAIKVTKDYLDLLKEQWAAEQALGELREKAGKTTVNAAEQQKLFNKAMEQMANIAAPALTDMQRLMMAYADAVEAAAGDVQKLSDAQVQLVDGLNRIRDAQSAAYGAAALSGMGDYAKKVAQVESGGQPNAQASTSSASGMFQFTDKTFLEVARSIDKYAALTDKQLLAQKNNVQIQQELFDKFTKDNAAVLEKHGIAINDATLYLAHFLGAQGAVDIISGKRGPNAAEIKANPFLAGMSSQDVVNWATRKMGGAGATVSLKDAQDRVNADKEDAQIQGQITDAYDEQAAKEAERLKFAELRRDLEKKAADEGRAVTQDELDKAHQLARAAGETAGREAGTKAAKTYQDRLQALEDENSLLTQQAQQLGAVGAAYDQTAVANAAANDALQTEQQLRAQGIALTDAQKAKILELATANETLKAKMQGFKQTQVDMAKAAKDFAEAMGQMAESAIGGLVNDLRNGVSAGEAFNNMLQRIIDSLLQMALQSIFNPAGGGGLFETLFKSFGIGHGGGSVSHLGSGRQANVSPLAFANAPRYAAGGVVGLKPGEVPIVAHRGEIIVPNARRLASSSGGGRVDNSVHQQNRISIDMSGSGYVAANSQAAKQVGEDLEKMIEAKLVLESRPGGLLRRVPS